MKFSEYHLVTESNHQEVKTLTKELQNLFGRDIIEEDEIPDSKIQDMREWIKNKLLKDIPKKVLRTAVSAFLVWMGAHFTVDYAFPELAERKEEMHYPHLKDYDPPITIPHGQTTVRESDVKRALRDAVPSFSLLHPINSLINLIAKGSRMATAHDAFYVTLSRNEVDLLIDDWKSSQTDTHGVGDCDQRSCSFAAYVNQHKYVRNKIDRKMDKEGDAGAIGVVGGVVEVNGESLTHSFNTYLYNNITGELEVGFVDAESGQFFSKDQIKNIRQIFW